jgi:alanyl-tRNA synthetase
MPSLVESRAYYRDSYLTSFQATIVETPTVAGHPAAVLDSTYFYPSSGGQPNDLGRLDGRQVIDVRIREDGAIVHLLDGPALLGPTEAEIDWSRRLDHMQQHTGQHILSQAFLRIAGAPTIGFHLGRDYASIDLDLGALSDDQRERALELANQVVREDHPIRAWFPTDAELATLTLRKTPDVEPGVGLRVVAIGEFDLSACGGTHLARTGEVGLIHGLKVERLKRGSRIAFLCGDRARADYAIKHQIVTELSAVLTCSGPELPGAVARLQQEMTAARRAVERHQEESLDREAAALQGELVGRGSLGILTRQWPDRLVGDLKGLALRLTASPNVIALLAAAGERTQLVFARSESVAVDLKASLDAAFAVIGGGRGGGGRVVQGAGPAADPDQVARALEAALAAVAAQ